MFSYVFQAFEIECKMADHVAFANRVRKSLYYGEYSDASLPSLSVTDVAVEVLNSAVPPRQRLLDRKYAHSVARCAVGVLCCAVLCCAVLCCAVPCAVLCCAVCCTMVASKYLYDEGEEEEVYNEDWAKAGSKTVQDINKLEIEFLRMMDWNLFISKDEFSNFVSQVESRVAITKGLSRGWLTYRDMSILLENENLLKKLLEIHQQLLKSISTCLAAYILGVSILLGSSSLATLDHNQGTPSSVHTAANPTFNCLTTEACVSSHAPLLWLMDHSLNSDQLQLDGQEATRDIWSKDFPSRL
ncbi:hypothetical protein QZH41_015556 [Actinostola sp. cb2023]|nr:hypothetical protein QZH41_015556 [Actinostola sp. cb2023]